MHEAIRPSVYNRFPVELSILIPTYARPAAINRCLDALAAQPVLAQASARVEIIVALDGPPDPTPEPQVPESIQSITTITRHDKVGYITLRRAMHHQARGDIILWLNDDSFAQPGLLETHLRVHAEHTPCVVAGGADWLPIDADQSPDLFDALVQRTDLVFFRQASMDGEPTPTSYRNCFGLNMSFPRALVDEVGGVPDMPAVYGYDDIELAHRLERGGATLLHAPAARVTHDHRYRPIDVHRREYLLGQSAWHYARFNPEFAIDLFKRDLTDPALLAYFEQSIEQESADAARIERSFLSLGDIPLHGPDYDFESAKHLLDLLAEHWVPLKRHLWRRGLIHALHGSQSAWSLLGDGAG
jgi:GT2 family glycosyltransferase